MESNSPNSVLLTFFILSVVMFSCKAIWYLNKSNIILYEFYFIIVFLNKKSWFLFGCLGKVIRNLREAPMRVLPTGPRDDVAPAAADSRSEIWSPISNNLSGSWHDQLNKRNKRLWLLLINCCNTKWIDLRMNVEFMESQVIQLPSIVRLQTNMFSQNQGNAFYIFFISQRLGVHGMVLPSGFQETV